MKNAEIERILSRMISEERKRRADGLPSMGIPSMAFQKIVKNLPLCKSTEIAVLRAALREASMQDSGSTVELPRAINSPSIQKHVRPAVTVRGTERQRGWGFLQRAVEDAIKDMDPITSVSVFERLKSQQFPFATDRGRSSIAKILRALAVNGGPLVQVTHGRGRIPVTFKRRERRAKAG